MPTYSLQSRHFLILLLLVTMFAPVAWAATVTIDDATVVAPKSTFGVGVNGGHSWYTPLGANLVDNACFEAPADAAGLSQAGWPWGIVSGSVTASVDTATFTSGVQSQKLVVTAAPAVLQQYHASIPQAPLAMNLIAGKSYVIKAKLKASAAATVNFGWVGGNGTTQGPNTAIGTSWATYSWTYTPAATTTMYGVTLRMQTLATYWVDDFIAWAPSDMDPATGLDATMVARLQELKPGVLRWGGLGVNPIPLATAALHPWDLSYGPPPLVQDLDLATFLLLCKTVGATAFICVPPAFSDAAHAALGDLNADVVNNWYADHGNLIDYVGGDAATAWGAKREAQGFTRFDLQVPKIYFELGNEVWGTPDGTWDMWLSAGDTLTTMMNTYATYCIKRITAMKARPGWRANMRAGFGGREPEVWIGNWAGSYNVTLVPQVQALADFSTISMYYGQGTTTDTDEYIFGGLFARTQKYARDITALKSAFQTAAGHPIETCLYEGNSVWGPGYSQYPGTGSGYDPMVPKESCLGSGVSLLDNLCAANRCGLTFANVFHFRSDKWGLITQYPQRYRRPSFYALKMFNTYVSGNLVGATVSGAGTWNDAATGESAVPDLACYPYQDVGGKHAIVLVNRNRTVPISVTINHAMAPTQLISLTGADINLRNDSGEVVLPQSQALPGTPVSSYTLSVPAFSACILLAGPTNRRKDFNADGKDDILFRHPSTGEVREWLMP